ncbi:hypothetical protein Tco_1321065, partial [Tanacetum coccineum]
MGVFGCSSPFLFASCSLPVQRNTLGQSFAEVGHGETVVVVRIFLVTGVGLCCGFSWLSVVVLLPGSVVVPPGSVVVTTGSVVVPPGSVVVPPGSVVVTTGSVVVPPGSVVVTTGTYLDLLLLLWKARIPFEECKRLISWQCKKQTIVANSTTEAEYVVAANCCGQVLWIQNQMLDYGFNFMNTKIYIDNESTICVVKNPVSHSKTKNIEIRHHFIRDSYEKKLIQVIKIYTDQNVADLLAKAFDVSRVKTAKDKHNEVSGKSNEVRTLRYLSLVVPLKMVGDEAVYKELGDRMKRAATTASSLEAEQDSGSGPRCQDTILGDVDAQTRFETTSKQFNDPPLSKVNTFGSGEDSMQLMELMTHCTKLSAL